MNRLFRIHLLFLVFVLFACDRNKESQRDAPALFLPGDLEATLWAESPMFYNPTNIDVDYRGRIWVTEAVNYRNFNNDSTKALHHSKGDRVVILEDTDGDGKADRSKVFVQDKDLVSPLGIAVIGDRVFVSCSPNLIVYTDHDGDDRPDQKEILLTGFGGFDHDHSLHAVVGGMDGRLYFNTGNAGPHMVTDKSGWTLRSGSVYTGGTPYNTSNHGNLRSDDGKVWVGGLALRMNPDGSQLRVVAHNFRNSYEVTVDSRGDMWQNDNDDQVVACRTTWVMEGGNAGYFSSDGTRTWQADQRPWQDVFTAHWHQQDPGVMPAGDNAGAGSPTGVVVYESDALGPQYLGMLLSADAGRNVIFGYHPQKKFSGYDLGPRQNLITSLRRDNTGYIWNDSAANAQAEKWFRPSDVAVGTDGALYIADWYDPVVGGHQMRDTTGYGRIYRIAPRGRKLTSPHLDLGTVTGQCEALRSPAINVRYTASQALIMAGQAAITGVREMVDDKNPYVRARAIWVLSRLGEAGVREVEKMLDAADEDTRVLAFRSLRTSTADLFTYAAKLSADPSPRVRREVLHALAGLPFEKTKSLLLQLARQYDGKDPWYLEALGTAAEGHEAELYRELIKTFHAGGRRADQWQPRLASIAWRLHPAEAVNALRVRASSEALSDSARTSALTALAFVNTPAAVKAMIDLSRSRNETVAGQATYWLAFRQGNEWASLWNWQKTGLDLAYDRKVAAMKIKRARVLDPKMPDPEKRWNVRDMAKDPVGAQMLMTLVSSNQLPDTLHAYVRQLLVKNEDPVIRIQAAAYFNKGTKENEAFSVSAVSKMAGEASRGSVIFRKRCSTCHRVNGVGQAIGPNLSTIKNKYDRQSLLDAIVHPDAGIVFGYEVWTITLKDGQSFFGFLEGESPNSLTIKDLSGKRHVIQTALIAQRKKQEGSLMPPPSELGLTEQDLADLAEYLLAIGL